MRHIVVVRLVLVLVIALTGGALQASEKKDITPGEANWHRYRFHVVTAGKVAVRQHVTVLWDNPQAGMPIAIYNTDNPNSPKLSAISSGNDRLASLDIGLLEGTYQLIIAAVSASTHYHLNSMYGSDEVLFQQPNGPLQAHSELFMDRLIGEDLAPYLARLTKALNR